MTRIYLLRLRISGPAFSSALIESALPSTSNSREIYFCFKVMSEIKAGLSCSITYEELRDLEKDFEDAETEISR